ncbi:butyrophilin-like protein 2 [Misgurnus anguillicaudatus]|uniref:butyrophilin-like protein 2 n=1 Tax=Misgurnus anguillicaudatus TaxID=75329 RepID=UPI003CCF0C43
MEFICVTLMIIIGITDSRADQFAVVGPVAPLIIVSGEDVILPCSLKPNISAVNMRVEWFRVDLKDSVVHLYEDHEDKNTNQLQSYRERTEVFKDELQKGNTSLKLSRVQISDEGLYKCFIQSKTWYDDITVDLRVEDQFDVIGPVAPLVAIPGKDVILPCSLKPQISAVNMRVEWSRVDLKVVHLYEDHEDKNTNQLQSYRGRTEVFKEELQKGNTSLKLSRVQISDKGLYTCFIQSKTWYDDITFDLRVEDQFAVVGPVAPLFIVSGEDVILPCSLKPNISAVNMRVEWFRLDLKDSVVHLYEDHEDKNTNQLQSYRERTEVFKDELQKGNTSLKLSRVQISDEGFYKCFIQSKTWYDDITVDLRVEDQFDVIGPVAPLVAIPGKDVILPCSLKPQISAVNMRVEWSRVDLKVVHLYEDHEDKNTNQLQSYRGRTEVFKEELQKGNTSLKLSRVQISDEGLYTCFIQSKTNYDDITVDLRVEAPFDVVGPVAPLITVVGEDVILPCSLKPNISAVNMRVEWFRLDLKVVHLYEDHEDKNTNQLQSYRGRTEMFKDELQKGNTALKLSAVQISDEGLYTCLIQSKTWYDDITVDLRVKVVLNSSPRDSLFMEHF